MGRVESTGFIRTAESMVGMKVASFDEEMEALPVTDPGDFWILHPAHHQTSNCFTN